jgi:hypothetical protein
LLLTAWPSGFVTRTLTRPAARAGSTTVSVVEVGAAQPGTSVAPALLAAVQTVAAVPPNVTVGTTPAWGVGKFVPVRVTSEPPAAGPVAGLADVRLGAWEGCTMAVTAPERVEVCVLGFVTLTSAAPGARPGMRMVKEVPEGATQPARGALVAVQTTAAVVPTWTVGNSDGLVAKPVPETVMRSPPRAAAVVGDTDWTLGAVATK